MTDSCQCWDNNGIIYLKIVQPVWDEFDKIGSITINSDKVVSATFNYREKNSDKVTREFEVDSVYLTIMPQDCAVEHNRILCSVRLIATKRGEITCEESLDGMINCQTISHTGHPKKMYDKKNVPYKEH